MANAGTTDHMAKGKPTPEKSKIERNRPLAYARRQKGSGGDSDKDDEKEEGDKDKPAEEAAPAAEAEPDAGAQVANAEDTAAAIKDLAIEPPPSKGEPWPDATPQPMRPVEPARAHTETVGMPAELVTASSVEDPTLMPAPRNIPSGHPDDPTLPPGRVPSGDSRSLRNANEFALIYRVGTAVITRSGVLGTRGQWRVVDYPTSASASNAYAKEVSRFVAEGFSDYRD